MNTTPQPDPAASPLFDVETAPLPTVGRVMLERMRAHFPQDGERARQTIALAEEAGEFVGAYRRWAGMARRSGGWDDVEAELADVLITAHVTGAAFNMNLPHARKGPDYPAGDPFVSVLTVFETVGHFTAGYLTQFHSERVRVLESLLTKVESAAWNAARDLDIDLEDAWRAKARKVFTRGWREA